MKREDGYFYQVFNADTHTLAQCLWAQADVGYRLHSIFPTGTKADSWDQQRHGIFKMEFLLVFERFVKPDDKQDDKQTGDSATIVEQILWRLFTQCELREATSLTDEDLAIIRSLGKKRGIQ